MSDVALHGVPEFDLALEEWAKRVESETRLAGAQAGELVQETGGQNSPHLTGRLGESWRVVGFGEYELQVGPTAVYARKVEFLRDYFKRTMTEVTPLLGKVYERAWQRAQRG